MPVIVTPPAQATAYRQVPQSQALRNLIDVELAPGRSTAIDFSHVQERIVVVNLADPSRTVFTSNAPIESGLATTLFVTPIQALDFPGLTTNPVTTLQVQTLTPSGDLRLYTFNVRQSEHASQAGVVITAAPEPTRPVLPVRPSAVELSPQSIAQGLVAAIEQGITPDDDPIVEAVKTVLANVEAGQLLLEAAEAQGVDIEVLEALAALGHEPRQGVPIRFDPI
ncbi:hypothetical protein GFS31_40860 (plasmid) [Leptolyngbya sp. BL0902]|uniref:hypothetical protein n=1 Tax=Leptolyngbya sp. BL0902 TaxID=1115757 RepID=UPI0018E8D90C|nr:hypothetical protein [Leptolyngbya sp. BL0902]QQE67373.1 hypothetical protein GFS31_40860 [Leptolyngbya sp. BL0902]